ncbi:MAG: hypothetical protein JWM25_1588 [Thermoleophilia bacterium]|nr:hypothetical protein [Thermoleophilia bacterium]
MSDRERHTFVAPASDDGEHTGMSAEEWQTCSKIFTEGRRMRTLAAELRGLEGPRLNPTARIALDEYIRAMERAGALGDIAAEALVARGSR